jgi:hypothetical protein
METPGAIGQMRTLTVSAVRRWRVGLAAAIFVVSATLHLEAKAADYPPSSPHATTIPTLPPGTNVSALRGTIDNPKPVAGQSATVVGQGFTPGEDVRVEVRSVHVTLGNAVAGSDGSLSLTFAVPASLRGDRSITLAGQNSGRIASIGVSFLAPPGTVQSDEATTLAVAIVGIGGLGMVLVAGGSSLLIVSRRHISYDPVLVDE